eukprot:gb/GFBE01035651.1/.p1 GENE.gb/GFBE01035651.1/~~gb/GFBE01035651.1/.p1  ORF type:complete len:107 (+),score=22.63 gb/GFBE01035651.1/:1-321(+)
MPRSGAVHRRGAVAMVVGLLLLWCGALGPGFFMDRNYEAPTSKEGRKAEYDRMMSQYQQNQKDYAQAERDANAPPAVSSEQGNLIFFGAIFAIFLLLTIAGYATTS